MKLLKVPSMNKSASESILEFLIRVDRLNYKGKICMYSDYKILLERLKFILSSEKIRMDELMKKHTTFKLGGICDIMIFPSTEEELIESIKCIIKNKVPYFYFRVWI